MIARNQPPMFKESEGSQERLKGLDHTAEETDGGDEHRIRSISSCNFPVYVAMMTRDWQTDPLSPSALGLVSLVHPPWKEKPGLVPSLQVISSCRCPRLLGLPIRASVLAHRARILYSKL